MHDLDAHSDSSFSFRMPAEHGAWGILLVPLLCSLAVAGIASLSSAWPVIWFLLAVLSSFLLRGSLAAHGRARAILLPVHLLLAAVAITAGIVVIQYFGRTQLLAWAALAFLLELFRLRDTAQNPRASIEKRSLWGELVGVALLTLTAPAAWVAARGALNSAAILIWLANFLFFMGGLLYVKYRIRAILAHRPFTSLADRVRFAWPVVAYHLLLIAFIASWVIQDSASFLLLAAFLPATARAVHLLFQLGRRFPIRRLGWTELAHSFLFALFLVLALRP